MTIQKYLQSLGEKLHVSPKESQKILREIQTHLTQEAERLEKKGASASEAEKQACEDFGDPAMIAKGFRNTYSWFFRTSLRVIALTLIVMVFFEEVPNRLLFAIVRPEADSSFPVLWFNILGIASYVLFAAIVFMIVQKITFSSKRLWRLLAITLITAYFGEILYTVVSIIIGMGARVIDASLILHFFLGQFIIITFMMVIYLCLYFAVFKKSVPQRSAK